MLGTLRRLGLERILSRTAPDGCPVAVEVFEGSTGDPTTVAPQVNKLRQRFGLKQVILVGDRGMLTSAPIREDLKPQDGLQWISALKSVQIQQLVAGGTLQLSLFDQRDLAEIRHPAYPGERLIACRNPLLAEERKRKRKELRHNNFFLQNRDSRRRAIRWGGRFFLVCLDSKRFLHLRFIGGGHFAQ